MVVVVVVVFVKKEIAMMMMPTRFHDLSKHVHYILVGILLSRMVVHSFQPMCTTNFCSKQNRCCRSTIINSCSNSKKAFSPCLSTKIVESDVALYSKQDGHDDYTLDLTRRELLSLGPALGIAMSILEQPLEANAAEVINRNAGTAGEDGSNVIPFSSVRKMKTITLSNGLRVLVINDKCASQSTAALIVDGVGQFTDPDELPGLAHLMEHMILSYNNDSKFGKRGDLEDWLADNGGTSNAFTAYQQVRI